MEQAIRVKVPLVLRPILKAHMRSNAILVENRYKVEEEQGSPRVVFYKVGKDSRVPASPRCGASFILFEEDINKDIWCRILGVKYIPRADSK